ncbi:hypothetical protein AJ80_07177 [Polytolypa hystricis UAMH7299]|uniref:DSC E3 ubiquitin ligase complex subunit A n=1 Tax=Polytolypa hystricis (strain UAMH7299) TaxID=1447883 RepID=A0A2B7XRQ7_POLH7|nr:hypothetical protein AJ80_07177 [Polytolypa hystricis UAMH7299]
MSSMESRRVFLLFVLLFFLLAAPEPRAPIPGYERERRRQLVDEEKRALSLLNSSRYGDFDGTGDQWLPLKGMNKDDGYAWGLLPVVQKKAREQYQSILTNAGLSAPTKDGSAEQDFDITSLSLPLYRNVTGKVRGDWVQWKQPGKIPRPHLNLTTLMMRHDYFTRIFGHNVTADHGTLSLALQEEGSEDMTVGTASVREIKADMILRSEQSLGESWLTTLYGVHFPGTGGMILTTQSEKYAGLSALPHFALSNDTFELSRKFLTKSLSDALANKRHQHANFLPWTSLPRHPNTITFAAPKCEYVAYIQQHPARIGGGLAQDSVLAIIEQELRSPIGAPIPSPPLMTMSAVIFSPDCGFIVETKDSPAYPPSDDLYLMGPKLEEYRKYSGRLIIIIAGMLASQVTLLKRQMTESSTPSTRSRVSFYTIAMMSMGDALFMSFIMLELYSETSFLLLTATAFLAFFSVSFLGMKFQIEIWAIQAPERREQDRRPAAQPATTPTVSLPLPVTAPRPNDTGATPIILPPDQDGPTTTTTNRPTTGEGGESVNDTGAMYTRFYFILFCLLFFSSWALFWPRRVATIYANLLSFIYLSFWTPQIYRNVMRNCRKALRWDFVIGQSALRVFPFLYFYIVRGNVLFVSRDVPTAILLSAWVWIQAWVLGLQDILGPRFFVPNGWAPPAYDYHPILRDTSASGSGEDVESGGTLPIGYLRAEQRDATTSSGERQGSSRDRKKKVFDCAICMQDIEVLVLAAAGGTGGGSGSSSGGGPSVVGGSSVAESASHIFSRRTYMVTPCRHIFHSTCLESWMRLRLQCPICRETIPPI